MITLTKGKKIVQNCFLLSPIIIIIVYKFKANTKQLRISVCVIRVALVRLLPDPVLHGHQGVHQVLLHTHLLSHRLDHRELSTNFSMG